MPVLQLPDRRALNAGWLGRDGLLNFAGFIPLGFFAAAAARRRGWEAAAPLAAGAILLGAALSLGIELVQVQLPARVSSATDLACNVLGTALGVWLALRGPLAVRQP
jgi:glycopeptide antibiotics resistance protein